MVRFNVDSHNFLFSNGFIIASSNEAYSFLPSFCIFIYMWMLLSKSNLAYNFSTFALLKESVKDFIPLYITGISEGLYSICVTYHFIIFDFPVSFLFCPSFPFHVEKCLCELVNLLKFNAVIDLSIKHPVKDWNSYHGSNYALLISHSYSRGNN